MSELRFPNESKAYRDAREFAAQAARSRNSMTRSPPKCRGRPIDKAPHAANFDGGSN